MINRWREFGGFEKLNQKKIDQYKRFGLFLTLLLTTA
jgi:hypothetical protein